MGSDRARRSHDESRQYRGVVHQQGRVVLEADLNEEHEITEEGVREEVLDIVGPRGTPDDGYQVSFPAELHVGPGTMYVGGLRVTLDHPKGLDYSAQPDWIDGPDPLPDGSRALVCLELVEREVSAVEDSALREVALGGPDTAQRVRLVQHIVVTGLEDQTIATCSAALADASATWSGKRGLVFDKATSRLVSTATLQAAFVKSKGPPDPCAPAAQEGYLGAENQLVRVQISPSTSPPTKILWGYDNAYFLYRITGTVVDGVNNETTLTLGSTPVDMHHRPRVGQVVEVLRAAVDLLDGKNYVAAENGIVGTLVKGYDPVAGTVVLGAALPSLLTDLDKTKALFVRIWEEELAIPAGDLTVGVDIPIGAATGLLVTLRSQGRLVAGDHWLLGVRPSTPQQVYPERYLVDFQPPDGPRRWACPLAVVALIPGNDQPGSVLADCRESFVNLVALAKLTRGCCTLTLQPKDLEGATLQIIVDEVHKKVGSPVKICLLPGIYSLDQPLRLGEVHSRFTLEGCRGGVVIRAEPGKESQFLDGLIVLVHADDVTLQGLDFRLPIVDFASAGGTLASIQPDVLKSAGFGDFTGLRVSVGVRPIRSRRLTVRDCSFECPGSKVFPSSQAFAACLFAGSDCTGLDVRGSRFINSLDVNPLTVYSPQRNYFGVLMMPSTTFRLGVGVPVTTIVGPVTRVAPVLDEAVLRDNRFERFTAAAMIFAEAGVVRFDENEVVDCYAGFWAMSLHALTLPDQGLAKLLSDNYGIGDVNIVNPPSAELKDTMIKTFGDPMIRTGSAVARAYPLPKELVTDPLSGFGYTLTQPPTLDGALVGVEITLVPQPASLVSTSLMIHATENDFVIPPSGVPIQGPAFAVWDTGSRARGSCILNSNRLRSYGPMTVILTLVDRCTVTGNLILNQGVSLPLQKPPPLMIPGPTPSYFHSLVLVRRFPILDFSQPVPVPGAPAPAYVFPTALVAITGNVLRGKYFVPTRPKGYFAWDYLNTLELTGYP